MRDATARTEAERVAGARRWFRVQGREPIEAGGVTVVATPAYPATWEANFVMPGPGVGGEAALAALEKHAPAGWQVVQVDCLTAPDVEAVLALEGFAVANSLIEMVAKAVAPVPPAPRVAVERVGAGAWDRFAALVEADHREGKRTGDYDPAVAAGLLAGMRGRSACDHWLLVEDGVDLGYGMTALCPNGLGLIENLFTLPAHRGRGVMSRFIGAAAARLRAAGCDAVFLDAHADDTPKRLYAKLGFRAVAVTRTWVRKVG